MVDALQHLQFQKRRQEQPKIQETKERHIPVVMKMNRWNVSKNKKHDFYYFMIYVTMLYCYIVISCVCVLCPRAVFPLIYIYTIYVYLKRNNENSNFSLCTSVKRILNFFSHSQFEIIVRLHVFSTSRVCDHFFPFINACVCWILCKQIA